MGGNEFIGQEVDSFLGVSEMEPMYVVKHHAGRVVIKVCYRISYPITLVGGMDIRAKMCRDRRVSWRHLLGLPLQH